MKSDLRLARNVFSRTTRMSHHKSGIILHQRANMSYGHGARRKKQWFPGPALFHQRGGGSKFNCSSFGRFDSLTVTQISKIFSAFVRVYTLGAPVLEYWLFPNTYYTSGLECFMATPPRTIFIGKCTIEVE